MQMQEPSALGRIVQLVRDLRRRCAWDAAQTPRSLRPYLVEEVLELDQALAADDAAAIRTELGDVLLHVAFQIVLAEERGAFGAEDLTRAVEEKMWARHPHLFPDARPNDSLGEERQGPQEPAGAHRAPRAARRDRHDTWERTKLAQVAAGSVLDGLPPGLPALIHAFRLQERAAGVGFDWPDVEGPLAKVREELDELDGERSRGDDHEALAAEVGDVLFAVVNAARKLGVDPRAALEVSNAKFAARFRRVESLAAERGIKLGTVELEVLDGLWEEVKREM